MDLDELRSVRRTERQKDSLQHLRDSFYEDVAAYIAERKAERRRAAEAADDPFGDPTVGQLSDEISTAEEVVEAIYERRVGKVVKLASFAAADMSADKTGLTAEERELFDDLVDRIKQNRQTVLETLAGEGGSGSTPDVGIGANADSAGANADSAGANADPTDADADSTGSAEGDFAGGSGSGVAAESPATDSASAPPADEPTAPDDVLAAAMGGGAEGENSAETTGESDSADGAPAAPPEAGPGGETRETSAAGGAETDGGAPDAALAAETTVTAESDSPSESGNVVATAGNDVTERSRASETASDTDAVPRQEPTAPNSDVSDEDPDRVTLRITADVGRILGVDEREYDLAAEDVVTLPATNAAPLLDRGAAERLE